MFTKLFSKILDSSIWLEPVSTRIVWITLIAAMDEDGFAHFSALENLASRARVAMDECKAAVDCFLSPDPNSSNPDHEGRRIERVPGGFFILNAKLHRDIMNRVVQREQTRIRVQRHRAKGPNLPVEGEIEFDPTITNARIILATLNEAAGRHYTEIGNNLEFIVDRLKEVGGDVDGVKMMIARQCKRWKGTEFEKYLRPATLFNKTKFAEYYDNRDLPLEVDRNPIPAVEKVALNNELDRLNKMIPELRRTYGDHQSWTDEDRKKLNDMQARRKELMAILKVKY